MLVLLIFAFLGGVVTVFSPCILPVLPIVLSSSLTGGRRRPLGVVTGFILSFTFFTLFLTSIVKVLGISANSLRSFSVVVILLFGFALLIPKFQYYLEQLFARLGRFMPKTGNASSGFWGGLVIGLSIGLIWTPCVGPILASVISLALTGSVNGTAFFITLAYSLGTAIPMLAIVYGGQRLLNKVPWLVKSTATIQKAFGVLMILTALAIYFNLDRQFQTYILEKFPKYGVGLTNFEDNASVQKELEKLNQGGVDENDMGKPSFSLLGDEGLAPEIIPGGEWFNSEPLKLSELRGKVVLVDFWTYTCINCIRTLPYLRSWHEKYSGEGLVIIGVHTPEFEFEKDADNVAAAIADYELKYSIVQDNDYATWRAYNNRFWPAKYLIDKDGRIRYHHFGEGKYDETEKIIQELLQEAGSTVDTAISNPEYEIESRTPELYLGTARYQAGYTKFTGDWEHTAEFSKAGAGAVLTLQFNAKNVFLVAKPSGDSSKIVTMLDNDAATQQEIAVDKNGTYQLVELDNPGVHTLEIQFPEGSVEVYAFTFG